MPRDTVAGTGCMAALGADGHIFWACEAFSKLHGRDLMVLKVIYGQTLESQSS